MTNIKKFTNTYGHECIKCHICETQCYVRGSDGTRSLLQHFTVRAKSEAFGKALGDIKDTKHLDYYIEHTKPRT